MRNKAKQPNSKTGINESDLSFDKDLLTPATIQNHINDQIKPGDSTPHAEILGELLNEFEPLDFHSLAFPEVVELKQKLETLNGDEAEAKTILKQLNSFKLKTKHYLILSTENVIETAKNNRWGICKNHDFIYLFNGAFWANIDSEPFQNFLGEAAENMNVGKYSARYYQFREQLFKQFLSSAYLPKPEASKDVVLINLKNGTFEISPTGTRLKIFDRNDFLTYQLPFDYDPEAKAPIFQKYLDRVLPDATRQKVLSEYLGYVFIKNGSQSFKLEKALLLYGTGANGKSVFFEIVNALLGEANICHCTPQNITNDNGYYRAIIANKLVNYASEINGKLDPDIFKKLVSGEPVDARLPYGKPFIIQQYAKLIFNCNQLPKDVEHTNAYFRRFLIIPFDETIPEAEQDKELHTKIIKSELSGVFNWILSGLDRLLKQKKFTECEAAKNAVKQYRKESDSVQLFFDEYSYKSSIDKYERIKDLYNAYKEFCFDDGYFKVSNRTFKTRLMSYGIQTEKKNVGNVAYLEKSD